MTASAHFQCSMWQVQGRRQLSLIFRTAWGGCQSTHYYFSPFFPSCLKPCTAEQASPRKLLLISAWGHPHTSKTDELQKHSQQGSKHKWHSTNVTTAAHLNELKRQTSHSGSVNVVIIGLSLSGDICNFNWSLWKNERSHKYRVHLNTTLRLRSSNHNVQKSETCFRSGQASLVAL